MRFRFLNIEDARDYILTGCILVFAVALLVGRNLDGLQTIRTVSIALFSYLEEPLSNIRIYRQALQTNEQLHRQNILLLDELSRLRSVQAENNAYRRLLDFKRDSNFKLKAVQIVGKHLTGMNNMLTIDVGSNQGVKKGMALVTSEGLVGRVILTSGNYAEVMPLINPLFRVSARIQGSRGYGVVHWSGNVLNELEMLYVPNTIPVDVGQIIETSEFSYDFPSRLPIGTVTGFKPESGKETQIVYLEPAVSFHQISEGFIIMYEPDSSLVNLRTKLNYE